MTAWFLHLSSCTRTHTIKPSDQMHAFTSCVKICMPNQVLYAYFANELWLVGLTFQFIRKFNLRNQMHTDQMHSTTLTHNCTWSHTYYADATHRNVRCAHTRRKKGTYAHARKEGLGTHMHTHVHSLKNIYLHKQILVYNQNPFCWYVSLYKCLQRTSYILGGHAHEETSISSFCMHSTTAFMHLRLQ